MPKDPQKSENRGTRTSLQDEIDREQDRILAELDELDARVLGLIHEFTARLRADSVGESADNSQKAA